MLLLCLMYRSSPLSSSLSPHPTLLTSTPIASKRVLSMDHLSAFTSCAAVVGNLYAENNQLPNDCEHICLAVKKYLLFFENRSWSLSPAFGRHIRRNTPDTFVSLRLLSSLDAFVSLRLLSTSDTFASAQHYRRIRLLCTPDAFVCLHPSSPLKKITSISCQTTVSIFVWQSTDIYSSLNPDLGLWRLVWKTHPSSAPDTFVSLRTPDALVSPCLLCTP